MRIHQRGMAWMMCFSELFMIQAVSVLNNEAAKG